MKDHDNLTLYSISFNSIHRSSQQLLDITDFDIVNGQRNYLTKWKLKNGQIFTRWTVLSQLGHYINKLLTFETQNNSMIQQKEKHWKKTYFQAKSSKNKRSSVKLPSESSMLTRNQRKTIPQLISQYSQPKPKPLLPVQIPIDQLDNYDISKSSSSQQPCLSNIFTDESEEFESYSDEFSYESQQSSQRMHKSQVIEVKDNKTQRKQDRFQQQDDLNNLVHDFAESRHQSSSQLHREVPHASKKQQQTQFFELMTEDFEKGLRYFSKTNGYRQPEDFSDYVSLHVISQLQILNSKPKIVNIIRFYNLRDGLFFVVSVGSLYYQNQRFIDYKLLKQYYPQIICTWFLILSQ